MEKRIIFVLLFVVMTAASCKKSHNTSGVMQAVIDGDSITTTNITAELQNGGDLYITANKASTNETISLILSDYNGLGNYNIYFISDSNVDGNKAIYQKGSLIESSTTGAINITTAGEKGSTIEGNFNFSTATNQAVYGTFSVTAP